jgi:hypothetical protein
MHLQRSGHDVDLERGVVPRIAPSGVIRWVGILACIEKTVVLFLIREIGPGARGLSWVLKSSHEKPGP